MFYAVYKQWFSNTCWYQSTYLCWNHTVKTETQPLNFTRNQWV